MSEMFSLSFSKRLDGATRPAAIHMAVLALVMFPVSLVAQGLPVETASQLPVALWFAGAGVLGLVLAYGILRNRGRTRAEKQITEQATKNLYAEEERDRAGSGAD
jgi:hypothetical protein